MPATDWLRVPTLRRPTGDRAGDRVASLRERGTGFELVVTGSDGSRDQVLTDLDAATPRWDGAGTLFVADGDRILAATGPDAPRPVVRDERPTLLDARDGTLLYAADDRLVVAEPRCDDRRTVAEGVTPARGSVARLGTAGERVAYTPAERPDRVVVRGPAAVETHVGDADRLLLRDWRPERGRLLVADDPQLGRSGVIDADAGDVTWVGAPTSDDLPPFAGRHHELPIAFRREADGFLARRAPRATADVPVLYDGDGEATAVDVDGRVYLDGADERPFRGADVVLRRETHCRPGDVIARDPSSGASETLVETDVPSAPVEPTPVCHPTADGPVESALFHPGGVVPAVALLYGAQAEWDARFRHRIQFLAAEGTAVLLVVHPGEPFTAAEHGTHVAVGRWLADRDDVDGVAAVGTSHGGYDACVQAARHPDVWRAAVADVPIADLFAFDDAAGGSFLRSYLGDPTDERERWTRQNPRSAVEGGNCPVLVSRVDDDFGASVAPFAAAMREANRSIRVRDLEQGHVPAGPAERTARWSAVAEFLADL